MIPLSTRTKESIKTALAMVVAYAIAFNMGWDKPYWAGFAVAMVSLDTAGASLNKATMRLLGTLVAGLAALTFAALFAQDRWSMIAGLSLYVGLCTYMLTGDRYRYFWFVSVFVTMVIMIDGATADSPSVFRLTVLRVQETGMGILVYSLISAFLWPQDSRGNLEAASRDLAATQGELFQHYRALMHGQGTAEESRPVRLREVQLATQAGQALAAAESDSYAVWELRRQWRRYHRLSNEVMETLERWRETFPQVQGVELTKPLPNLDSFCAELDRRFAEIAELLSGEAPKHAPEATTLRIDQAEARALGHFEKAAAALAKAQLDRLEELSRSLLDTVLDIRGYGIRASEPPEEESRRRVFEIDPDRLGTAVTAIATLWIGFLIWVYIDPPGGSLFMYMAATWVMGAALARQSVTVLPPAFLIGIAVGGVLYIFVMPQLSGYLQLGSLIFGVTFAIFYLCWAPRRRLLRSALLALFNVLIFIDNQQSYDFVTYASTSAAILLSLALAMAVSYFPTSPRPEKTFLHLFRRFCRHADFMLSRLALDRDSRKGWAVRWRTVLYAGDLLTLPDKMARLAPQIDYTALPGDSPEKVGAMATNLKAIAYRIKELSEARELPHSDVLVRQFQDELRAWRELAQEQLRLWAEDPERSLAPDVDLEERLAARMQRVDSRIEETYRKDETSELSERDYENFFRYLGGLRGLSESGIGFIRVARTVDWARWREARF